MRTYLFYLDESGQREGPEEGYFVLASVGVPIDEWQSLNRQITDLKWTYFSDPDVELKSTWLRNPRERPKRYLEKYGVADGDLVECVDSVYDALTGHNVIIIAAVIDKARFGRREREGDTPLSLAYKILFERIERCLQKIDAHGILIFDKIEDAEMKRAGYEKLLTEQHRKHREEGTEFVRVDRIIEGLLFIRSSDNNGIQLADLCAYNVMRQFRDFGHLYHDRKGFLTEDRYELFARIECRLLRMTDEGRYTGHALRRFPTVNSGEWKERRGGRHGVLATDTEGHRITTDPPA